MNRLRFLTVLAVAVMVVPSAFAANKAKKKDKPVKATVVEVKKDADKESGTLKVMVSANKKKNTPAAEKTFKVTEATKVEKVMKEKGKKAKDTPATPAKFSDIPQGAKLQITAKDDEATAIKFSAKKKKKNK